MVEDGIAILKVGPALTFGLREGLFALDMMERFLVPESEQAHFMDTLERVMLEQPGELEEVLPRRRTPAGH
jgi:D-tagatose-1,6-bisphosphate aldolase subunit GatZ/KbaZ